MNRFVASEFQVSYSYRLNFTQGIFDRNNPVLAETVRKYRPGIQVRLLFILDSGVMGHHFNLKQRIEDYCSGFPEVMQYRSLLEVPGGELVKNDPVYSEMVLEEINRQGICRHSVVVVIGGGAVIDMAGYAAAIAHRGVQIIRIPTTVLSQNDAAVGVKNGLNLYGKKNFIGTFAVPLAILNDSDFLISLEDRDWIAGMAEAVKVALIKDHSFFEYLEANADDLFNRDQNKMEELIYRCAKLHMEHISDGGDPFERGSARPLDFGHWAAHKLEHLTAYELRHGEAVALGMVLDSCYARNIGLLNVKEEERIIELLIRLGFRPAFDRIGGISTDQLMEGIEEFREHLGGELSITLPNGIGKKVEVHEIDRKKMITALDTAFRMTENKKIQ